MKLSIRILTATILLCAGAPCAAQELRLSGGYSGSQVSEAGDEQWTGQAGYLFGVDLLLGDRWFVKPGVHLMVRNLNYTTAGTAPDGSTVGTDTEFRYTSRSLRVPVHLGLHLLDPADDPALNLYVLGGPTALMALDADLRNDELDVQTRPAQWYIGFGGGLELGFLFAEVGYDVAMSNVFKGESFSTNPRVNNVQAIAGIRLRLAN